ncbi:MAG: redoxin domain-containing protein [Proteobacteria bacterium]|nr:redoxin domain-containing protein [Pseudomonadota bacterium]
MSFLQNGDPFPHLEVPALGGGTLSLSGFATGAFGVILAYRGAWCPFCTTQLAGYASEKAALDELGVRVAAFSVDDEPATTELAAKLNLDFFLGYGVSADQVHAILGAFTNESPRYLQPTAFILTPRADILASVYASHAVGRLLASDAIKLVSFVQSKR